MEKLRFGRGLDAGLGFGSGDTEEGIPSKKDQQEEIVLLGSGEHVDTVEKGILLRALEICLALML